MIKSELRLELQKREGYWPQILVLAVVGWALGFILSGLVQFFNALGFSWFFCSVAIAIIVSALAYGDGVNRGAELAWQLKGEDVKGKNRCSS